jgi:hypothetical protein
MKIKPFFDQFDSGAVSAQTRHAVQAVGPIAAVQSPPSPLREDPPLYTPKGQFAAPSSSRFHAIA